MVEFRVGDLLFFFDVGYLVIGMEGLGNGDVFFVDGYVFFVDGWSGRLGFGL